MTDLIEVLGEVEDINDDVFDALIDVVRGHLPIGLHIVESENVESWLVEGGDVENRHREMAEKKWLELVDDVRDSGAAVGAVLLPNAYLLLNQEEVSWLMRGAA